MSDAFDQTGLPQMISNKDSEIKARYALAVLRVARAADRETAARLVQGLARASRTRRSGGKLLRFTSNSSKLEDWRRASALPRWRRLPGRRPPMLCPNGSAPRKETESDNLLATGSDAAAALGTIIPWRKS